MSVNKLSIEEYPFRNPDLPLDERVDDLISRLTLEEKISLIPTKQAAIERLGIKEYSVGGEAAHGWVSREGDKATVFPQTIGLACTWNIDLMEKVGSVIADEARAYHKMKNTGLTLWAPTVDMERDPRWGRTEESYGEDPYLTGEMASALVKGMQGSDPHYLKMAATLKHFFANNNEEGRCYSSVSIDRRNMKEYYWSPFKQIIKKADVSCMMTAYNEVNGTPCILNKDVKNIVKDKWGLSGFVVADGADFSQTVTMHKYYSRHDESIADTIKSGIDCIPDDVDLIKESLHSALNKNLLKESDLDQALRNIFNVRFRLGEFDPDRLNPYSDIEKKVICSDDNKALALEAAQESIVLLKNDNNMLPIQKEKIGKVAVVGPLADEVYRDWYTGVLPYKITPLQGIKNKLKNIDISYIKGTDIVAFKSLANNRYIYPKGEDSIVVDGTKLNEDVLFDLTDWGWGRSTIRSIKNNKYLTTDKGLSASADEIYGWFVRELFNIDGMEDSSYLIKTWDHKLLKIADDDRSDQYLIKISNEENSNISDYNKFSKKIVESGIEQAVAAAKSSDIAIVCVGNNPLINGKEEIDREDISLAKVQEGLIKAVYEANPNTIVVLISSYPVAINWVDENIPAIIYSSHGGQELGNAVADVLFGDYHPAARLNMTWYKSLEQLPDIKNYDIIKGKRTYMYFDGKPLYPFGYGLTYTYFKYSNLHLSSRKIKSNEILEVSLRVENIGLNNSDEVIQLYVSSQKSRVLRPQKELKAFKKINFQAGESKEIKFSLAAEELNFWDVTRGKYLVESGLYNIMIGPSSDDIRLESEFEIAGELIPPRKLNLLTEAQNFDDYYGIVLDEIKEIRKTSVRFTNKEDWISFQDVDFRKGVNSFQAMVINEQSEEIDLEVRLDSVQGDLLGKLQVNQGKLCDKTIRIKETEGIHNIYFRASGELGFYKFCFYKN